MENQSPISAESMDQDICRVLQGQTAAFEPIVRRFERPLRAWLATQAPPAVDVDELAQRSFVVAFSKLADFNLALILALGCLRLPVFN